MTTISEALRELNNKCITTNEDLNDFTSLPVQLLPVNEVKDYIHRIPAAQLGRPPVMFKLGYMKELDKEIAAKFKGGRGSEGNPRVRIIKCTEYSKLYTGVEWRSTNATKKADTVLGSERHTGERSGFRYADEESANRIGVYPNGKEALQAYIADGSVQKVKFFISIDGGELQPIDKNDVAQYLTPATANRVLNGTVRKASGTDEEGNEIFDKPVNRFALNGIYMIGNLGHSVM